jgi:hypothetical protein
MNWGNKLLITFIVFIGGMSYLVYRSVHTEFQLVEKEYYKSEIAYQQVIDGSKAAEQLSTPVSIYQTAQGIAMQMPNEMKGKALDGNIWFYCAYEQKNDKHFPIQLNENGLQLISIGLVTPGNYIVKISWQYNNKTYYTEKAITIS